MLSKNKLLLQCEYNAAQRLISGEDISAMASPTQSTDERYDVIVINVGTSRLIGALVLLNQHNSIVRLESRNMVRGTLLHSF